MPNKTYDQDDIERDEAELAKRKAKRKQQNALAAVDEFLELNELYFISRLNAYFLRTEGGWTHMKADALRRMFSEMNDRGFREALVLGMEAKDRIFHDVTYALDMSLVRGKMLNLMDTSSWLKPVAGEYHWFFDMLMHSIAGGKPENIEHLERLIAYKIAHPYCPSLPALMVHGEGSLGKNLLVEQVMTTVFAGAAVTGTVQTIMGDFNSPLKGMVVALIDEAHAKKVDHDKLKNMLGSNMLWLNEKGIPQYKSQAIAWIIISSNKHEGGIFLDRSSADRRYSVFYVEKGKDLIHWLCAALGEKTGQPVTREDAAVWISQNLHILRDKEQVARWMHALLAKYEGQHQPLAFHGEDFERLMDIQCPVDERIIPDVFNHPDFTHIDRKVLYQGYKLLCKEDERHTVSSTYFYAKVRAWLTANRPDIHPVEHRQRQKVHDMMGYDEVTTWLWSKNGTEQSVLRKCNSKQYVNDSDRYRPIWIGPEGH